MAVVLSAALAILAQASSAAAAEPQVAAPAAPADDACENRQNARGDIVICAERPQGYRLDPDVMEAKRELRSGKTKPPESFRHSDCGSVGPMGCRGGAPFDVVGAALAAVTMAEKAIQGEKIGDMLITDPHPSEYQLYVAAKRRREARERQEKAEAAAAKVKAEIAAREQAAGGGSAPSN